MQPWFRENLFPAFQGVVDSFMNESLNASDTWIPNISLGPLPDASFRPKFCEHILLTPNADLRQSAVTSPSSSETRVLCLIVIAIAGFSETEANSKDHVGRVTAFPILLHVQEPVGDQRRGRRIRPMKVWTVRGFLAIPGAPSLWVHTNCRPQGY